MPLPLLAWIGLASLGGVAAASALGARSGFVPGAWYRVRARVNRDRLVLPPSRPYVPGGPAPMPLMPRDVQPQIEDAMKSLGFSQSHFARPNPRDFWNWELWTKYLGPPGTGSTTQTPALQIVEAQPVRYPSRATAVLDPFVNDPSAVTPWIREAVATALALDTDPERLDEFAKTLLPDLPESAALVRAKRDVLRDEQQALGYAERLGGLGYLIALDQGRKAKATASVGRSLLDWIINPFDLGSVEVLSKPLTAPFDATVSILQGEPVGKAIVGAGREILESAKTVAPYVQMGISFIPGVGTVASAAIGAELALASGRPITDAIIEGVKGAVPGGPLAVAAFETGAKFVGSLAEGKRLDQAALDGARQAAVSAAKAAGGEGAGKAAGAAFDASVAVAQGKRFQDVATRAGAGLVPGGPAGRAAFDSARALAQGRNLQDAAVQAALGAARSRLPDDASRLAFDAGVNVAKGQPADRAVLEASQKLLPQTEGTRVAFGMTRQALRGEVTPATLAGEATKLIPNMPGNPVLPGDLRGEADRLVSRGLSSFTRPELWLDPAAVDAQGNALNLEARRKLAEAARAKDAALAIDDRLAREKATALERAEGFAQQAAAEARSAAEVSRLRNWENKRRLLGRWAESYLDLKKTFERGGIPFTGSRIYTG